MKIRIILVPYDSGRRSWRMGRGPESLLAAGLLEELQRCGATVDAVVAELPVEPPTFEIAAAFELQRLVAGYVAAAADVGAFSLALPGNCNTAVGDVGGMMTAGAATPAVCWFDAHGDFNTPEITASGFLDGMALAMLTGRCCKTMTHSVSGFRPVQEEFVILSGARDIEPREEDLLRTSKIYRLAANELPEQLEAWLTLLPPRAQDAYVHIDLDALIHPSGSNEFAVPRGIRFEHLANALGSIERRCRIRSAAITAYDPDCDPEGKVARAAVKLAVRLVKGQQPDV